MPPYAAAFALLLRRCRFLPTPMLRLRSLLLLRAITLPPASDIDDAAVTFFRHMFAATC